jgi:hypothetical protein
MTRALAFRARPRSSRIFRRSTATTVSRVRSEATAHRRPGTSISDCISDQVLGEHAAQIRRGPVQRKQHQRGITLDNTFLIESGVASVPPGRNPFYGSATVFQYPSALRLGAKFSFLGFWRDPFGEG